MRQELGFYLNRFNRDLHLGAGLLVGVWFWGVMFSAAILVAFLDLAIYLATKGVAFSGRIEDADIFWAAMLGVLGVIWKLFATKHSEVECWADEKGVTENRDLLRRAREDDGLLPKGVWFWGVAFCLVAFGAVVALACLGAGEAFGRAAAPVVTALGLIWQVFLGALADRRRASISRRLRS